MRSLHGFVLVAGIAACGGKSGPPKPPVAGTVDAGIPPVATVSKLPDAKLPPPFQLGSPFVDRHAHAEWTSCFTNRARGVDAAKSVDDVARACAATTKLTAVGSAYVGNGSGTSLAQLFPFHAEAKHCYRLYAAAAPSVKSLVVAVRDANGRTGAEYRADELTSAIAPDEALCFTAAQEASVAVSVGSGDGAFAIEVWGD